MNIITDDAIDLYRDRDIKRGVIGFRRMNDRRFWIAYGGQNERSNLWNAVMYDFGTLIETPQ